MYISYINKKNKKVVTIETNHPSKKNERELVKRLHYFDYLYDNALEILEKQNISDMYETKYIQKKNGKFRRIDVPNRKLMEYQKALVDIFTNKLEFLFPESVYGYVKGKSAKDMAKVHTNKEQIIKVDIKDFFRNCTLDFVLTSMFFIYPFCLIKREIIKTIIQPCFVFYDGDYRLPQGGSSSPILSNIAMLPLDCNLEYLVRQGYEYTRFADDIVLSRNKTYYCDPLSVFFERKPKKDKTKDIKTTGKAIKFIEFSLEEHNPNFKLNAKKTKVLNAKCGDVWMLGVSVGKDVKIGNKKKQLLKASLWSFLNDCKNGKPWSVKDTRRMLGKLGYAKYIEPEFVINLITKYEQKSNVDFKKEIQKILC